MGKRIKPSKSTSPFFSGLVEIFKFVNIRKTNTAIPINFAERECVFLINVDILTSIIFILNYPQKPDSI